MIDIQTPKFSGVMTQIWEPRHREIDQAKRLPERCLDHKPRIDAVTLFDVNGGAYHTPAFIFSQGLNEVPQKGWYTMKKHMFYYVVRHYEDWSDGLQDCYDQVVFMNGSKDACEEFIRNVDDEHPYVDDKGFCEMYETSYSIQEEVPGMLWWDDPYGHKGRIVEYDINGNPLGVGSLSYDYCHCSEETTAEIASVIAASKE